MRDGRKKGWEGGGEGEGRREQKRGKKGVRGKGKEGSRGEGEGQWAPYDFGGGGDLVQTKKGGKERR